MLDSNFIQQRVFVVGEDSLFDQGITHLLAQRTDFLVSRAKFSDEPVFLNAIEQDLPDVILAYDSGSLDAARITGFGFISRDDKETACHCHPTRQ